MMKARLKITIEKGEVVIRGDREGLEYLADACRSVIGHRDPSGHWHLEAAMNNLCEGSVSTLVQFTDDEEDFKAPR